MFLETISGDKLHLNIETNDHNEIKQELHKKYGYDTNGLYVYWTGRKYIVGFFNKFISDSPVNQIVYERHEESETKPFVDYKAHAELLINKKSLTRDEKKVICKNLEDILREVFKDNSKN